MSAAELAALQARIASLEADLQFRREFQHGAEALAGKYLLQRDDSRERVTSLETENFALAAGQCIVSGGLCGDESGNQYCSLQARIAELEKPIDMVLHCPKCGEQHIDAPDEPDKYCVTTPDGGCASTDPRCMHQEEPAPRWTNPPHRSHLCKHCGFIWRPADVATNGVAEIKTKGKDDMVLVEVPAERLHKMRQTRATTWVSFADAAPPVDVTVHGLDPTATVPRKVLVTNNLHARDATGRMSHVWLAMPHEGREGWVAFDEGDRKIRNLTHWRDPFAGDAL